MKISATGVEMGAGGNSRLISGTYTWEGRKTLSNVTDVTQRVRVAGWPASQQRCQRPGPCPLRRPSQAPSAVWFHLLGETHEHCLTPSVNGAAGFKGATGREAGAITMAPQNISQLPPRKPPISWEMGNMWVQCWPKRLKLFGRSHV